jgi:phage shock protein PspC (stress-responsive transcriptional regulator)
MTEITGSSPDQSATGSAPDGGTRDTTLTRPSEGRMLAGVASGLANYTGIDVLIVRIAFVALTLLGFAGIAIYLACWVLMPAEDSGRSIAGDFTRDLRARSQDL